MEILEKEHIIGKVTGRQPPALLEDEIHYRYFSVNLTTLYVQLLDLRQKRATLEFNVYYVTKII